MTFTTICSSVWKYLTDEAKLSPQQLQRISVHKYKAGSSSVLESSPLLIWDWVASQYPAWLAPNSITICGLAMNILGVAMLGYYSPDAKQEAPNWVYFSCAAVLFIYNTCDGTDGIHARRTGTVSPMGELFDHGCDSLSQVLIGLELCMCIRAGEDSELILFLYLVSVTIFFCAHWQTYVTGVMQFHPFDATEGEFCVMFFLILSGCFGASLWSKKVFFIPLKYCVIALTLSVVSINVAGYLRSIFVGGVGKDGSTVADTSIIFPVIPWLTFILPAVWIYRMSPTNFLRERIIVYCVACGFVASKRCIRLILATVSRSSLDISDTILWGPFLVWLNYYFGTPIPEHVCLHLFLLYSCVNWFCYCWTLTRQICDYMNIDCFRIQQTPK